jgi:hypothetical protein
MDNFKIENFNKIKALKYNVDEIFINLEAKIKKIEEIYDDLIHSNKERGFIFGLDSFYFQTDMLKKEYKYLYEQCIIITNRMYCEYYKLYRLMINFVEKNNYKNKIIDNIQNKTKFPVYKDLDDTKYYDFNLIVELNNNIFTLLNNINGIVTNKEKKLNVHTEKQKYGLNIDNFVATYDYEVNILKHQIVLYKKYLLFFHKLHEKYLSQFIVKMNVTVNQINNDIKFEGGIIVKREDVSSNNTVNTNISYNVNDPVKEPVNEPVKEPVNEPVNEPVKEPVNEPVNEPVKEPVNEPVNEPVKEPVKELVNETNNLDVNINIIEKKNISDDENENNSELILTVDYDDHSVNSNGIDLSNLNLDNFNINVL